MLVSMRELEMDPILSLSLDINSYIGCIMAYIRGLHNTYLHQHILREKWREHLCYTAPALSLTHLFCQPYLPTNYLPTTYIPTCLSILIRYPHQSSNLTQSLTSYYYCAAQTLPAFPPSKPKFLRTVKLKGRCWNNHKQLLVKSIKHSLPTTTRPTLRHPP